MKSFFDSRSESYDKHIQENLASFYTFCPKIAESIVPTAEPVKTLDQARDWKQY